MIAERQVAMARNLTVTRRSFLKLGGASAAAAAVCLALARPARAAATLQDAPEPWGVLTDLTRCIGCRACEVACNKVNTLPPPETPWSSTDVFETARRPTARAFTVVNRYGGANGSAEVYRKVQCMHCIEPACVSACPVAAMIKTPEGPVIWDERVCFGCRYCMVACPFNVPAYEYSAAVTPRVRKCTMCYERVCKEGGLPACVQACPTQAIVFGKRDSLLDVARQRLADKPGGYVNHIYGEHEAGGTSWLYLSPVPFEEVGFPNVETTPSGDRSWGFLASLSVVEILGPVALIGMYEVVRRREQAARQEAAKEKASREQ